MTTMKLSVHEVSSSIVTLRYPTFDIGILDRVPETFLVALGVL